MNRENIGIGSFIFYLGSFFILASIPLTVYLLRSTQGQFTGASAPSATFSKPPSFTLAASRLSVASGENIGISMQNQDSNWYTLIFSQEDPSLLASKITEITDRDGISHVASVIFQASEPRDISYIPRASGYFMAIVYQAQNSLGDFRSGDTLCMWDGTLYIYKSNQSDGILGILRGGSAENTGMWQRLTQCSNSGPLRVEVR